MKYKKKNGYNVQSKASALTKTELNKIQITPGKCFEYKLRSITKNK